MRSRGGRGHPWNGKPQRESGRPAAVAANVAPTGAALGSRGLGSRGRPNGRPKEAAKVAKKGGSQRPPKSRKKGGSQRPPKSRKKGGSHKCNAPFVRDCCTESAFRPTEACVRPSHFSLRPTHFGRHIFHFGRHTSAVTFFTSADTLRPSHFSLRPTHFGQGTLLCGCPTSGPASGRVLGWVGQLEGGVGATWQHGIARRLLVLSCLFFFSTDFKYARWTKEGEPIMLQKYVLED